MDMPQERPFEIDADELIAALFGQEDTRAQRALDLHTQRIVAFDEFPVDNSDRYRAIEPVDPSLRRLIATDFVDSLPEHSLREVLEEALLSTSPETEIDRALMEYPEDRYSWSAFCRRAYLEAAGYWLDDQGIPANLRTRPTAH